MKNGYYVARNAVDGPCGVAHASSSSGSIHKYWKGIWNAKIPPKIRMFVWRLMKGIVPTKVALKRKYVDTDLVCSFCGEEAEEDLHLFKLCSITSVFWAVGALGLKAVRVDATYMREWIMNVMDALDEPQRGMFFVYLWVIWTERNNLVWKDGFFSSVNAVQWAAKLMEDYHKAKPPSVKQKRQGEVKWQCSPSGCLKVNFDGSYRADHDDGGVGVVIRDSNGQCVAARAKYF